MAVIEDPCNAFTCDPRYKEIENKIDDMRIGDLTFSTPFAEWSDGPEDFVEWLEEENYDYTYDGLTTILSVISQYLDERASDDYEFEQEDLDELYEYALTTSTPAFFPER